MGPWRAVDDVPRRYYDGDRGSGAPVGEGWIGAHPEVAFAAGTRGRKLRGSGAATGSFSRGTEPADGRDRQREIDCGGRAGAAAWGSRVRRYGPHGRNARA